MLLSQIPTLNDCPAVSMPEGRGAHEAQSFSSSLDLARNCVAEVLTERWPGAAVELWAAHDEGRVLRPVTHRDPACST